MTGGPETRGDIYVPVLYSARVRKPLTPPLGA